MNATGASTVSGLPSLTSLKKALIGGNFLTNDVLAQIPTADLTEVMLKPNKASDFSWVSTTKVKLNAQGQQFLGTEWLLKSADATTLFANPTARAKGPGGAPALLSDMTPDVDAIEFTEFRTAADLESIYVKDAAELTATDALGNRVVGEYVLTASDVAPELTIDLSVREVQQGEQLVIRGGGFAAGEDVSAVVRSTPVTLAPGVADANGDVVFTFNTPADFALGAHTVTLTGATSGEIVSGFTVIAAANQEGEGTPEAETQPEETLPVTGASGTGLLGAGTGASALVLAGLSLMLWRRRVA